MRKVLGVFVGVMLTFGAMAAGGSDRQSCSDIKGRIDTLAGQADLNDSDSALLTDLRASYRRDCTPRTSGRGSRTIAAKRVGVRESVATAKAESDAPAEEQVTTEEVEEVVIADNCENPDSNGCCPEEVFADFGIAGKFCCKDDYCFPPMEVKVPEKTEEEKAEEIAENIEKGLCGDGTKPNKFGCCTGETFKDLGNATFGCCKADSEECFPPMESRGGK